MAEDMAAFDLAAEHAQTELNELKKSLSAEQLQGALMLAAWWKKWYMQAGHKRLGRIVVNFKADPS